MRTSQVTPLLPRSTFSARLLLVAALTNFSLSPLNASAHLNLEPKASIDSDSRAFGAASAVTSENFELSLETAGETRLGSEMHVEIHLSAKNGKKVNFAYPLKVAVLDTAAWKQLEFRVSPEDKENPEQATILVRLKSLHQGSHQLALKINFGVCDDGQCLVNKEVLTDQVAVL
jgi:hypothetical protein